MAYATQAEIEAILGRALTASELVYLAGLQLSVDNWINSQTGIDFGVGATTRFYDGCNTIVAIDPVRDITSVTAVDSSGAVATTYTDGTDYVAGPYNEDIKTYLERRRWDDDWLWWNSYDSYNFPGEWPSGAKRIAVTGTFSYSDTIPSDIAYLSAYLAAKIFGQTTNVVSGIKQESIEGYSRTYADVDSASVQIFTSEDPVVQMVLENYTGSEIFF